MGYLLWFINQQPQLRGGTAICDPRLMRQRGPKARALRQMIAGPDWNWHTIYGALEDDPPKKNSGYVM